MQHPLCSMVTANSIQTSRTRRVIPSCLCLMMQASGPRRKVPSRKQLMQQKLPATISIPREIASSTRMAILAILTYVLYAIRLRTILLKTKKPAPIRKSSGQMHVQKDITASRTRAYRSSMADGAGMELLLP